MRRVFRVTLHRKDRSRDESLIVAETDEIARAQAISIEERVVKKTGGEADQIAFCEIAFVGDVKG